MMRMRSACLKSEDVRGKRHAPSWAIILPVVAALAVSTSPVHSPSSLNADDAISPPALRPPVVSMRVEAGIEKGLRYLAALQAVDGSFGISRFRDQVYPTVMSAMVGLTFMANGSTITRGPYARNIRRIADYLLENCVTSEGLLMNDFAYERRPMYGHAFAMAWKSKDI